MTFPNAASGVKKLFIAEILHIIGMICVAIGGTFTIALSVTDVQSAGAFAGSGAVAAVGAIVLLVAFIIQFIGLSQASKDESQFLKSAFTFAIVGIIIAIASAFFPFFYFVREIIVLFIFWFTIAGIMELAARLGDEDVLSFGKKTSYIILATYIIGIILAFLQFTPIASVLVIISVVLELIGIICVLVFYAKAKNMLETK